MILLLAAALPGEPLAGLLAMDVETGMEILAALAALHADQAARAAPQLAPGGRRTHTITGGPAALAGFLR